MKFTTLSMIALGFAGLTVGQFPTTTVTSVPCINPVFCHTGPHTRSNTYSSPTVDSTEITRTITEYRRQESPSPTCTSITTRDSTYAAPISTHTQCGPDTATPSCFTSYECGCGSTAFTQYDHPDTYLCWPPHTETISYPDYGGGRSQPGRRVAREAKVTLAPSKRRSVTHLVAARATSQDFGGHGSQRRVAREAEATPVGPCLPGFHGPKCPTYPIINPKPPRDVLAVTPAAALDAPDEANKASSTIYTSTYTGTRIIQCPPGVCGSGCRWGHECNKLFGRVPREAEATAGPEVVHTTLLTVRA